MKFVTLLCVITLLLPIVGGKGGMNVAVTIPPLAEFAMAVGGESVNIEILIPPGSSPHTYEPKPGQLKAVSETDMCIFLGSGIEFETTWLRNFEDINGRMLMVNSSEGIELIKNDPHVWLSLKNVVILVENICEAFVRADPENRDFYVRNSDSYIEQLRELDKGIEKTFSAMKTEKILVFHGAWAYFCSDYGLEQITIEEGGKDPTAAQIAKAIEGAKKEGIKIVFASPQEDKRYAEIIAKEIGGKVILIDPLAENYLDNMRKFADIIGSA